MDLQGVLEGMLFIVGEEGLTLKQISEFLEIDNDKAKELLLELKKNYENSTVNQILNLVENELE